MFVAGSQDIFENVSPIPINIINGVSIFSKDDLTNTINKSRVSFQ